MVSSDIVPSSKCRVPSKEASIRMAKSPNHQITRSPNPDDGFKVIVRNRKARYDYHILDTYEAGIELKGSEVKSLRAGKVSLADCYANIDHGEVFLYNVHINPYEHASHFNHEPMRKRRLLLHKAEIRRLTGSVAEKGQTLIPLQLYFKRGIVKVELALAKGKRDYDRRRTIADRDARRDMDRELRSRR